MGLKECMMLELLIDLEIKENDEEAKFLFSRNGVGIVKPDCTRIEEY